VIALKLVARVRLRVRVRPFTLLNETRAFQTLTPLQQQCVCSGLPPRGQNAQMNGQVAHVLSWGILSCSLCCCLFLCVLFVVCKCVYVFVFVFVFCVCLLVF
jgi:hypothetical protein